MGEKERLTATIHRQLETAYSQYLSFLAEINQKRIEMQRTEERIRLLRELAVLGNQDYEYRTLEAAAPLLGQ